MKLVVDNIGNRSLIPRFTNNDIAGLEMNIDWVIINKDDFLNEVVIYKR